MSYCRRSLRLNECGDWQREFSQYNPIIKGNMTKEEFVTTMLEKRRKKEIEDYVEEVLEGMTEMELTGPSVESLEGRQLNYGRLG